MANFGRGHGTLHMTEIGSTRPCMWKDFGGEGCRVYWIFRVARAPELDQNRPVYVMRLKPRSCLSNFRVDIWAREKDYPQVPTANLSAWQSDHRLTISVMVGPFDSRCGTQVRALCNCIQIGIRGLQRKEGACKCPWRAGPAAAGRRDPYSWAPAAALRLSAAQTGTTATLPGCLRACLAGPAGAWHSRLTGLRANLLNKKPL